MYFFLSSRSQAQASGRLDRRALCSSLPRVIAPHLSRPITALVGGEFQDRILSGEQETIANKEKFKIYRVYIQPSNTKARRPLEHLIRILNSRKAPLQRIRDLSSRMSVIALGESIPALTPHVSQFPNININMFFSSYCKLQSLNYSQASSVSLPEWADNIGYEEGDQRVVSKMSTGYPRSVSRNFNKVVYVG